jgi:RNA polymerase sigma factor (TIGR02999 family)
VEHEGQALQELMLSAEAGDENASAALFAALYTELHRLAESQLRRGGSALSLNTTTLLHEAYLDIVGREGVSFPDRARFMGYAARAMHGLIVDYARRSNARKRGGGVIEITFADTQASELGRTFGRGGADLERLSDALGELASLEPGLAELVDLHFFCGFSLGEIAELRRVSERTVQRDWRKARLFLHEALRES